MKKLLMLVLVTVMLVTAACTAAPETAAPEVEGPAETSAPTENTTPAEGTSLIGLAVPSMISLYDLTGQALEAKFPDYQVQIVSADDNVSNQVQQIQNFTTMGAKMIIVAPTEIEAIADALIAARRGRGQSSH